MSQKQQFFAVKGGLDQITSAIEVPPGRAIGMMNHESTGAGMKRTDGFERFDGRAAPSDAAFSTLTFTAQIHAFIVGQTITGQVSGATARVLDVAQGATLPVHLVVGAFIAGEALQVGGVTYANLNSAPLIGDWRDSAPAEGWLLAAQAYARQFITAAPGSGPVRGVVWYGGKLNAWRDNADASAGVLYHSTANGWSQTDLGKRLRFTAGGPYEIKVGDRIVGDESGATATVRYIGVDSGDWTTSDAAGLLILDNVAGSFGGESISVGIQTATATVDAEQAAVTFPPGGRYEFDIFNFYATETFERCYGANGVSKAFEFDGDSVAFITTGMENFGHSDTPKLIREHKLHLFLTFEAGSLQHSALGTPRDFSGVAGAAELGMGHDITAIIPNNSGVMLIFTDKTVSQLTGNDSSDWLLEPIADRNAGARPYTAQKVGDVLYLDSGGLRSAASSQSYANFKLGTYSVFVGPELERKRSAQIAPVASCVIKSKAQYLLFFADGTGISLWCGGKQPEAALFQYPFVVSCSPCVVEIDGKERVFVGAEDGFVYELNSGTSFDGEPVEAYFQLAFAHQGAPRLLKRYSGLELEVTGAPGTEIGLITQFDYASDEQPFSAEDTLDIEGGGGLWGSAVWGEFVWSAPAIGQARFWLEGMGVNMSPIFVSRQTLVPSYSVTGVTTVFSPRGAKR